MGQVVIDSDNKEVIELCLSNDRSSETQSTH